MRDKMRSFVLQMTNSVLKNEEFCIQNDGFCSGAMTYQIFCTGMQRLGVKNEAIAKGMFEAFDTNNDGSVRFYCKEG